MTDEGTPTRRASTPRFEENLTSRMVIPSVWDALSASAAKLAGATHLSLSGAALANSHGYPDRGLMETRDISKVVLEITSAVGLPVLVDGETGFGGGPRMSFFIEELLRAGCTAMMIEDQNEAGETKTVGVKPALCSPETMCERIAVVRRRFGTEMSILARTDYLPGMDPEESFTRLASYLDSGASWVQLTFPPSKEVLVEASRRFPGILVLHGSSPSSAGIKKYVPAFADLTEINPLAIKVTGQYRNAHQALIRAYGETMGGHWAELFADRMPPLDFDEALGLTRPGMQG